jgi:cytochrome bd ubiquinol oxidase subunit I
MPDVLTLSRLQFALTIMFHYLFPPLTIGLGALMSVMEGLFLKTRDPLYERMARFWTKIFAVNFALGVSTGIVMEFQFGTNWASYSRFVGDVFGSALAAEGIFAFFLESGFLAVLVFGWDRVSPKMHFFSTVMVFVGSVFSAVWIVVAGSWQHTPAGFQVVGEGLARRAEITDFWAMVFNPSSAVRLTHTVLGAFVLGAFFVMSVSAWYLLRGRHREFSRRSLRLALGLGILASLLMPVTGHVHARVVARHQPAKLAAFEGHFETGDGPADFHLFGWPDEKAERMRFSVAVPGGLSWLVHGDFKTPVPGLDRFPKEDRPPVAASYFFFRLMLLLGLFHLAVLGAAAWATWRGTLESRRGLLWTLVFAVVSPFIANQAGWVAAEVGRQPWTVYGLLRTSDSLSKSVSAGQVLGSIIGFGVIYLMLFAVWVFVLDDKIRHGPEESPVPPAGTTPRALLDAAGRLKGHGDSLTGTEGGRP